MIKIFLKFRNFVISNKLIEEGDSILLSFSGGPDSTALALLLKKLQKYINFELSLFYLNHGLRDDSDEEEKKVKEFANRFELRLFSRKVEIKAGKANIEEMARAIRYEILKEIAEKHGFNKIATAHNLDDQIETFLIRLLRGSGSKGLSSIPIIREGFIIRPLLEIRKREILDYLKMMRIEYVTDKTNFDTKLLRNKIRHSLIPLLENEYNPAIVKILKNEIEILRENEGFIKEKAKEVKGDIIKDKKLNLKILKKEHPAIRSFLIREYIRELRGSLRKITYSHVKSILELKKGQKVFIPDLILIREYDFVLPYIQKKVKYYEYKVKNVPFRLNIKELEKTFEFSMEKSLGEFDDKTRAFLDFDKIKFPIIVRKRKKGDRYSPLGMKGKTKKIKDIFNDMKISKSERDFSPVFTDAEGEILWVKGLRINDKYKVDESTENILRIEEIE